MEITNILPTLGKDHNKTLSPEQLACALYEGMPHLQGLATKLAHQHGGADALPWFDMAGEEIQSFWIYIAKQLIEWGGKYPQWGEGKPA